MTLLANKAIRATLWKDGNYYPFHGRIKEDSESSRVAYETILQSMMQTTEPKLGKF